MDRKSSAALKLTFIFLIMVAAGLSVRGMDRRPNQQNGRSVAPSATMVLHYNLGLLLGRIPLRFPTVSRAVSSSAAFVMGRFDGFEEQISLVLQGCVFLLGGYFWMKKSRRAAPTIPRP
jgi:hypothetical protein